MSWLYVSSAVNLFTDDQLLELLQQARAKNLRLGITGMLLYRDGNFIQVLEGEDSVVRELVREIELDPRHKGFTTLIVEPITERQFADWSMGFKNLDGVDLRSVPGFNSFLEEKLDGESLRSDPAGSRQLLMTFRENA